MTPTLIKTLGAGVLACGVTALASSGPLSAQTVTTEPAGAQAFSPENAILNTAIPFSVGAREAQQALRGSFGWATFQEGLVQGSYFRFDPDGYARFSPSPRLDTDVFEVICRPRTYVCMARKGPMTLTLSSTGQVQLKLEQSTTQDQFFLNDGFAELQIPARIIGTLDQQLETLLGSGGTLVTRRNGNVLEEVPLTGFPVVTAYLRWLVARQDYAVLPTNWPVPRTGGPNPDALTQPVNWNGAGRAVAVPVAVDPAQIPADSDAALPAEQAIQDVNSAANMPLAGTNPAAPSDATLAALQAEVAVLRDMLIAQTGAGGTQMPAAFGTASPLNSAPRTHWTRDPSLQSDLLSLEQELGAMTDPQDPMPADAPPAMPEDFGEEARHLHYLTVSMGLDAKTALMILQLRASDESLIETSDPPTAVDLLSGLTPALPLPSDMAVQHAAQLESSRSGSASGDDYQPLTDYFRSLAN
ncbi:hypothetical protein [Shimia ponticola]|uniref:hypothetical protein n=1 Tax=Shimia ponticola TaxID=2582893 RepID=UPI0011BDA7EC|nr:hypothetical protein [Shimia ponticola]